MLIFVKWGGDLSQEIIVWVLIVPIIWLNCVFAMDEEFI